MSVFAGNVDEAYLAEAYDSMDCSGNTKRYPDLSAPVVCLGLRETPAINRQNKCLGGDLNAGSMVVSRLATNSRIRLESQATEIDTCRELATAFPVEHLKYNA